MAKQTLGQGDSNVVVRNQVVYGALPQDVIDRMGDTTLALQTTEQNVLPAINELKSNLIDFVDVTVTTTPSSDVAPFSCSGETTLDNSIDINKVVGATIYDASLSYKNPAQAYVYTASRRIRVWTKSAVTLTVRVLIKG